MIHWIFWNMIARNIAADERAYPMIIASVCPASLFPDSRRRRISGASFRRVLPPSRLSLCGMHHHTSRNSLTRRSAHTDQRAEHGQAAILRRRSGLHWRSLCHVLRQRGAHLPCGPHPYPGAPSGLHTCERLITVMYRRITVR